MNTEQTPFTAAELEDLTRMVARWIENYGDQAPMQIGPRLYGKLLAAAERAVPDNRRREQPKIRSAFI